MKLQVDKQRRRVGDKAQGMARSMWRREREREGLWRGSPKKCCRDSLDAPSTLRVAHGPPATYDTGFGRGKSSLTHDSINHTQT